jgi:hypothetical protein
LARIRIQVQYCYHRRFEKVTTLKPNDRLRNERMSRKIPIPRVSSKSSHSKDDLHLSDLEFINPPRPPLLESREDFEFSVASANRDIEAARMDVQSLMARAHAYATTIGVATGTPILPSIPPRHRNSIGKLSDSQIPL